MLTHMSGMVSDTLTSMKQFAGEMNAIAGMVVPRIPGELMGPYSARVVRARRACAYRRWVNRKLQDMGLTAESVEAWVALGWVEPIAEI